MTSGDLLAGLAGQAIDFDGADDRIDLPPEPAPTSAISLSAWFRADAFGTDPVLVAQGPSGAGRVVELGIDDTSATTGVAQGRLSIDGSLVTISGGALGVGSWHHLHLSWDSAVLRLYVDGTEVATQAAAGSLDASSSDTWTIGGSSDATGFFDGVIDEIRLSAIARTAAWVADVDTNVRTPGAFVTIGAPEAGPWLDQGDWLYRKPVAIDPTQIAAPVDEPRRGDPDH